MGRKKKNQEPVEVVKPEEVQVEPQAQVLEGVQPSKLDCTDK